MLGARDRPRGKLLADCDGNHAVAGVRLAPWLSKDERGDFRIIEHARVLGKMAWSTKKENAQSAWGLRRFAYLDRASFRVFSLVRTRVAA